MSKEEHTFEAWEPPDAVFRSDFTPVDFSALRDSAPSDDFEEWDPTASSVLVKDVIQDMESLRDAADGPNIANEEGPDQTTEEEIDPNEIAKYTENEKQEFGQQKYQEGRADSESQLAEKYKAQEQELLELLDTLALEKIDTTALELAIRELLIKSVELITRAPIEESKNGLENIIQELVKFSQRSASDDKLICISEADFQKLDSKALKLPKNIRIKADPNLNVGDARIEIEESTLENFYEDRLKKVCFELVGK